MPRTFGCAIGKLAASTLSATSTSRVASRSDRLACQCVYQSSKRDPARLRERRGEHQERRDHVHEHAVGAAERRRRARARTRARGPPCRRASKVRTSTFAGSAAPAVVAREHDELVDARGERRDEVERLRERRRAPGRASA